MLHLINRLCPYSSIIYLQLKNMAQRYNNFTCAQYFCKNFGATIFCVEKQYICKMKK